VRLHWGSPETQDANVADMLRAAELGFIRPEEFRKSAVKLGWELWENAQPEDPGEADKAA